MKAKKGKLYYALMKNCGECEDDEVIVMCTEDQQLNIVFSGVVVYADFPFGEKGEYSSGWISDEFKEYTEELILNNK